MQTFKTTESASKYLRQQFEKHTEDIKLSIQIKNISQQEGDALCHKIWQDALWLPNIAIGDQIESLLQYEKQNVLTSQVKNNIYYGTFDYSTKYATTLQQEED